MYVLHKMTAKNIHLYKYLTVTYHMHNRIIKAVFSFQLFFKSLTGYPENSSSKLYLIISPSHKFNFANFQKSLTFFIYIDFFDISRFYEEK